MAVRVLLKGRDVLAVLPMGYGPRKKRFCHCQGGFQKSIPQFHACISRQCKYPVIGMKTRLLRTIYQKKKP